MILLNLISFVLILASLVFLFLILTCHLEVSLRLFSFFSWERKKLGRTEMDYAKKNLYAALGRMVLIDILAFLLILWGKYTLTG